MALRAITSNDIDIFGQESNETDLFFMNESSISNISRESLRVQALSGMILSSHKFNGVNSRCSIERFMKHRHNPVRQLLLIVKLSI